MDGAAIELVSVLAAALVGVAAGLVGARVILGRAGRTAFIAAVTAAAALLGVAGITASSVVDQEAAFDRFRAAFKDARFEQEFERVAFVVVRYRIEAFSIARGDALGSVHGRLSPGSRPPLMWVQPAVFTAGTAWLFGGLAWFLARRGAMVVGTDPTR